MRRVLADKLISIGGGVALLLLLAVQEKVCPQLLEPPAAPAKSRAATPATPAQPQTPEQDGSTEPEPIPLTLTSVLPDAVPARWSGLPSRASVRDTAGWCSGVSARQPLLPPASAAGPFVDLDATPFWRLAQWLPTPEGTLPRGDAPPVRDPALHTVLTRTGPPQA
ncbi:MAG: hypothetical protein PVJ57_01600 [Phycisphaerae bacterium]